MIFFVKSTFREKESSGNNTGCGFQCRIKRERAKIMNFNTRLSYNFSIDSSHDTILIMIQKHRDQNAVSRICYNVQAESEKSHSFENFSLKLRHCHCQWRASHFDIYLAFMTIAQWGLLNVPNLLWNETPVYLCDLLELLYQRSHQYNFRNNNKFILPQIKTTSYMESFLPFTTKF